MSTGGGNDQPHNPDHTSQPGTPRDQFAWLFTAAHDRASMTGPFTNFMRTRTAGGRCELSVLGLLTTLTSAAAATDTHDTAAESVCWRQLRTAMTAALEGDPAAGGMLPAEITSAAWDRHGQHIRIRHPGTTTRVLQCAQRAGRRGIGAVTPLTLLGALSQPLIGGATAAGIALAPVIPAPHQPTPPAPGVARALTGDVWRPAPDATPDAHPVTPAIGPGAPLSSAHPTPSPLLPWPSNADERDTVPTPAVTFTPAPTRTRTPAPAAPTQVSTPDPVPSATPTPSSGELDDTPALPTTPAPAVTPTPTVKHFPDPWRHRHHKHPLRRILRGR